MLEMIEPYHYFNYSVFDFISVIFNLFYIRSIEKNICSFRAPANDFGLCISLKPNQVHKV